MVNITITVPEALKNRLDKFPELNKSEMFQNAAEKKMRILEQLNKIETEIPVEIIAEIKEELERISFQFGKDECLEWIKVSASYSEILKAASLAGKEGVYDEFEDKMGHGFTANYNKIFSEQNEGANLDHEEFIKGFILEAKMVVNAINNS